MQTFEQELWFFGAELRNVADERSQTTISQLADRFDDLMRRHRGIKLSMIPERALYDAVRSGRATMMSRGVPDQEILARGEYWSGVAEKLLAGNDAGFSDWLPFIKEQLALKGWLELKG